MKFPSFFHSFSFSHCLIVDYFFPKHTLFGVQLSIIDEYYDFDRPGDSGLYKTLFIGDKRRIRPITTKLKKFTEQLINFDKKHEREF